MVVFNLKTKLLNEGTQANFDKQSSTTTTAYNVAYDYGSVMHYSPNAFSRNGQPTITPKVSSSFFPLALISFKINSYEIGCVNENKSSNAL